MKHTRYHKVLRTSAVVVAMVLLFDGGYLSPVSKHLSENTYQYLANSVGVQVGVPETDISLLTAQLTAKENELAAREAELNERTIATRNFGSNSDFDYSTYLLSTILFLLTVLIVLNYALDWTRYKEAIRRKTLV